MLTMHKSADVISTQTDLGSTVTDQDGVLLGVDVGGTNIRAALADAQGRILAEGRLPTRSGGDVFDQLGALAGGLLRKACAVPHDAVVACVGVPGIIDPASRQVRSAPNVPEVESPRALEKLGEVLGIPVVIENDVNLAALGEWVSLTHPPRSLAVIALGTGIGLGLVVDGQLIRGEHGAAGEIAALPFGGDPFSQPAGNAVLESVASTPGLLRLYAAQSPTPAESGEAVVLAWKNRDLAATRAVEQYTREVARAVIATNALVDPGDIVLTGGLGSNPFLRDAIATWLNRAGYDPEMIRISTLRDRAGLIGAIHTAAAFHDGVAHGAPAGAILRTA